MPLQERRRKKQSDRRSDFSNRNTFYVKIMDGIEDTAQKQGYSVMICHVGALGRRTHEQIKFFAFT
ncbi:hypothetical protein [Caproicibacter fermentans]|uniref:hypothetical protein n=1 Tax=Caproicibacter fermentans TaxID=2576756 RepID=UPI0012ECEDFF|nr:hypothetical protein [Caproicibacter fermentans]